MTYEEIRAAFFRSKAGFLEEKDLRYCETRERHPGSWLCYICPCGSVEHYAVRSIISDPDAYSSYPSPVLNCFETGQQWLVRPVNVQEVIREEEERYIQLLERAPAQLKKVVARRGWSEATIAYLKDTHGIERELAEEIYAQQESRNVSTSES